MTLSNERVDSAVVRVATWLLLWTLMTGVGGCKSQMRLEIADRLPINSAETLLIDVVHVEGADEIRKIDLLTPCEWFVDGVRRVDYDHCTTNWKVVSDERSANLYRIDSNGTPELASRYCIENGRLALEYTDRDVVQDLPPPHRPLFGGDHVPRKVFVFANFDLGTIKTADEAGSPCGRRLVFDPYETSNMQVLIKRLALTRGVR